VIKVAFLGIGEAGDAIAADLARAGAQVVAYDPSPKEAPSGVRLAGNAQDAVRSADLVLSLNLAAVALDAARSSSPALGVTQVFADLNTSSPRNKRAVADALRASGVLFVDVALLAPVPGRGVRTPALASGPGARRFFEMMTPFGMPVTVLDGEAGDASARKLVRSIFMKGLAAAVIECLDAAEALGCSAWAREQILTVLREESLIDRLVAGSRIHAVRRVHEMEAARELLAEIGVAPFITSAAIKRLESLRDDP
jgi:3-hydroxyisobutyrate dehydrogenase-like beta-hydroxyacid dehydrogenase